MSDLSAKKTYSRIGFTYAISYLVYSLLVLGVAYLCAKTVPEFISTMDGQVIVSYGILILIIYPVMFLFIKNMEVSKIPERKLPGGLYFACFPLSYAIMFLSNLIGQGLNGAIGAATGKGGVNPIAEVMLDLNPILLLIVPTILAPIFEELFFRKFLIDRTIRFGEVQAMLMSGLMFGLFHGNLVQFAYAFTLGAFFAYIYIRTGKIIYTILLHLFINGTSSLLVVLSYKSDINIDTLYRYLGNEDTTQYMNYVNEHIVTFSILVLLVLMMIYLGISGLVLLIVLRKKFKFQHLETELPKGTVLNNVIVNPGMLFYILVFLYITVATQISFSVLNLILKYLMG